MRTRDGKVVRSAGRDDALPQLPPFADELLPAHDLCLGRRVHPVERVELERVPDQRRERVRVGCAVGGEPSTEVGVEGLLKGGREQRV